MAMGHHRGECVAGETLSQGTQEGIDVRHADSEAGNDRLPAERPPTPEEPFAELFPQQWVGIYEIIQWGPDPGPQRP